MRFREDPKQSTGILWVMLLLLPLVASCAGQGGPPSSVMPDLAADQANGGNCAATNQWLWGYWEGYIPPSHDSLELVPVRVADIHLNARRLLEDTPCAECLNLLSVEVDDVNQLLRAEIELTHPYPGAITHTAFDVRGVVITDGSRYFPALDVTVPDPSLGDFTLLEPDGYTHLWNTTDFPPGSGPFLILEYSKGEFAWPGEFTARVNPYIEFVQEPRSHFPAGGSISREFVFNLVPGALRFGYAVDASWEPPTVDPPEDIWTDFPPRANALEPYVLTVTQKDMINETVGSTCYLRVYMADRQNPLGPLLQGPLLEAPDLWEGVVRDSGGWGIGPEYLWHRMDTSFRITNEQGAPSGTYRALLKVVDGTEDYWLGDINHRYELIDITVVQTAGLFEGEIVFVSIAPWDDPYWGAENVFLLDLETMQKTMFTEFTGIGEIFEQPRINPTGTHALVTYWPTPDTSRVYVYEIGGSFWNVTPAGAYDSTADFHPDGEHILVTSGTQSDDTPELYSMRYDGSERTLIAVAPGCVRNPRWSPDGNRIVMAIVDYSSDPAYSALWLYNVAAGSFTELHPQPGRDDHPSWSPVPVDGHYLIAYDHRPGTLDGNHDISVLNSDTGEVEYELDFGCREQHPSFSPDGLSVVFSSTHPGGELFVHTFPTEQLMQITYDNTMDSSPSWGWNW